jgi:hypothetical protein
MTTTSTTIKMPTTLHFTKTIKEVRVYTIRHELTYDEFKEKNMDQKDDESDDDFKKRCDEVWDRLCWDIKGGVIDLGEIENEEDAEDEWDGDVEQECGCDIDDLIEQEKRAVEIRARRMQIGSSKMDPLPANK